MTNIPIAAPGKGINVRCYETSLQDERAPVGALPELKEKHAMR